MQVIQLLILDGIINKQEVLNQQNQMQVIQLLILDGVINKHSYLINKNNFTNKQSNKIQLYFHLQD